MNANIVKHATRTRATAAALLLLAGIRGAGAQVPSPGSCPSPPLSGACYYAVSGSFNVNPDPAAAGWASSAVNACQQLGAGWALASIINDDTKMSVLNHCGGTIAGNANYWTGLFDKACCNHRSGRNQS